MARLDQPPRGSVRAAKSFIPKENWKKGHFSVTVHGLVSGEWRTTIEILIDPQKKGGATLSALVS